mmetsp:Transcript_17810/g.31143  ORF Transcript_17810/g.31143 Transcript_17810/m.31143 type:complete len:421 (-) Transcript_17810:848-2110(-)
MPLSKCDVDECARLLHKSVALSRLSHSELRKLSSLAEKKVYGLHDVLHFESVPQDAMYTISQGEIRREKVDLDGKVHVIDTTVCGNTVGALHVLNRDPAFATARCNREQCVAYRITSEQINKYLIENPYACRNMALSLAQEVRKHTRTSRTPLFHQQGNPVPVLAVGIAAAFESFYRSAMNALINQALLGGQRASFFPNMHIQLPTRILYILGFKGIRQRIEQTVDPERYQYSNAVRVGLAVAPGVIMTPLSSILEASNAGSRNPEPLWRRSTRGIQPRLLREVIFGIGLNQLSDFCEERAPSFISNPMVKNMFGSLSAGLISGYLSHVPHNISALMLHDPSRGFRAHFTDYVNSSKSRLPASVLQRPPRVQQAFATAISVLAPAGMMIRTAQIAGSFLILNGTISGIARYFPSLLHWGV